jgi:hypothetical protein
MQPLGRHFSGTLRAPALQQAGEQDRHRLDLEAFAQRSQRVKVEARKRRDDVEVPECRVQVFDLRSRVSDLHRLRAGPRNREYDVHEVAPRHLHPSSCRSWSERCGEFSAMNASSRRGNITTMMPSAARQLQGQVPLFVRRLES